MQSCAVVAEEGCVRVAIVLLCSRNVDRRRVSLVLFIVYWW